MRFDLRLRGETDAGVKCHAVISVYADSQKDLKKQADLTARQAAWLTEAEPHEPIPDGAQIIIEHVEKL